MTITDVCKILKISVPKTHNVDINIFIADEKTAIPFSILYSKT